MTPNTKKVASKLLIRNFHIQVAVVSSKFRNLNGQFYTTLKGSFKSKLTIDQFAAGILQGDRVILGQAITLIESTRAADQTTGAALQERIISKTGNAIRIGITGVPGVGKSTFIETFGKHIISQEKKLAVLTIDPSSQLTKGSILGDKTRMEELSKNPSAFIRPTASGNTLGGVAHKTREVMLLCEAAGYDVIIVETVGVGQSEVSVKNMVDFFLLLMLAGAGDELQGIKKGIMEMADGLVITKADGDNTKKATEAMAEYQHAFHLFAAAESGWTPRVLTSSAVTGEGIKETWKMILKYRDQTMASGFFDTNRSQQNIAWFQEYFDQLLKDDLQKFDSLQSINKELIKSVGDRTLSSRQAALQYLAAYHEAIKNK
jgi:LAO/AO transport system kinase